MVTESFNSLVIVCTAKDDTLGQKKYSSVERENMIKVVATPELLQLQPGLTNSPPSYGKSFEEANQCIWNQVR